MGKVSCEYVSVPLIQKKGKKKHTHTEKEREEKMVGQLKVLNLKQKTNLPTELRLTKIGSSVIVPNRNEYSRL